LKKQNLVFAKKAHKKKPKKHDVKKVKKKKKKKTWSNFPIKGKQGSDVN